MQRAVVLRSTQGNVEWVDWNNDDEQEKVFAVSDDEEPAPFEERPNVNKGEPTDWLISSLFQLLNDKKQTPMIVGVVLSV